MVKVKEISQTATFAWSNDASPLIATGTLAGAMDDTFSSESTLQVIDPFDATAKPKAESAVDSKFHSLAWSAPFDNYEKGLLAGALENGTISLWDAQKFLDSGDLSSSVVSDYKKHTGTALQVKFNPIQHHILGSCGTKGEIFIWDTKKGTSFAPGQAISPLDRVSSFAWNNSMSHIFATAGNTSYTSIWDLKAKREVLQLSYSGSNLSVVEWHPSQSTKLVTASGSDESPLILTWDLRNANAPETILKGHKKGVLSLDWCKQDPELLLSSGKDDATMLWNPVKGIKLCQYPSLPNWVHETKFAPKLPEIFASASFDKKLSIQTLQDTSPPVSSQVKSINEDDFWNEISTTDTQQPVFEVKQAPSWLQRPASATFGFGGKLAIVKKDKTSSVVKISKLKGSEATEVAVKKLDAALTSGSFKEVCESKVETEASAGDRKDWSVLLQLLDDGKLSLLKKVLPKEEEQTKAEQKEAESETEKVNGDSKADDDDFFATLGSKPEQKSAISKASYSPKGEFKLFNEENDFESKTSKLLLAGKADEALDLCISEDHILEGLVLALKGTDEMREKIKSAYFSKYASDSSLARVLYSVSNESVSDVVENADIESWSEIAESVLAHCEGKPSFNENITKLGDRLLNSTVENSRDNAIACYIAGDALDRVSKIWLSELEGIEKSLLEKEDESIKSPADARFNALGETIAKILAFQSVATPTSGQSVSANLEQLGKAYQEYSETLVNSGYYELAYKLLEKVPDSIPGVKLEKDRITKAFNSGSKSVPKGVPARAKPYGVPQQAIPSASPYAPTQIPASISPATSVTPLSSNPYAPYPVSTPSNGLPTGAPPAANAPRTTSGVPLKPVSNPYAPRTALDSLKQQRSPQPGQPSLVGAGITPPPPPKSTVKKDVGGWNDLPTSLGTQPVKRASQASIPTAYNYQQLQDQLSQQNNGVRPPSRTGVPPQPLPPPPRTVSQTSLSRGVAPPTGSVMPPPKSNKYGPSPAAYTPPMPVQTPEPPVQSRANSYSNPYAPKPEVEAPLRVPVGQTNITTGPPVPMGAMGPIGGALGGVATTTALPPPRNPYAPKTETTTNGSFNGASLAPNYSPIPGPPSIANVLPPAVNSVPQAAPFQQSAPPPPPAYRSSSSTPVPAPVPAAEPAVAQKEKYPPGDRSHIPESSRPIFEQFSAQLDKLRGQVSEKFTRHLIDSEKRLNILFDHLNNEDLLSEDAINGLLELSEALASADYAKATSLQTQIAVDHVSECGEWMLGVKRLITMSQAFCGSPA